jgi:iron complex outermembrane receptor protein
MNSKLFKDHLSFDLTLFSTVASDLIFTVPAPAGSVPPVENLNAKKVSNTGLELSTKFVSSSTQLSVNYMYLQQNDTPLPFAPKHKLSVQLQSSVQKLMMNLEYQFISGMYTDYPATTLSKYSVVDLALVYPLTRKIQLKVTGNNLFDEKYQIMKGYPMPGRVLMGGFTLNLF